MVDILMAVYNGEKFIEKQLNSIINQTYQEFILWIRDDGSTDNTIRIVKAYQDKYPKQIKVIEDNKGNLGVCKNFNELLKYSNQDYCMFCDQDDIWLPEKIEKTLKKMNEIERGGVPALVFTNLQLIDEKDNIISNSMWNYGKINPNATTLNKLLFFNVVTGCTMMVNHSLIELSGDIPKECVMHDYWFALIAASFGTIGYLNKALIQYRQHTQNLIGSPHNNSIKEWFKFIIAVKEHFVLWKRMYKLLRRQAYCLLKNYGKIYKKSDKELLINFIKLPKMNVISRVKVMCKYKLWTESNKIKERIKLLFIVVLQI